MPRVDSGGGITQAEYQRQLRSAAARAAALKAAERTPPPQAVPRADFSSIPTDFRPPAPPTVPPVITKPAPEDNPLGPGVSDVPGTPGTKPTTRDEPPKTDLPLDWHAYLTAFAIDDKSVQQELERIFRSTTNPEQATAMALAYVRGTDWYAKTYPGIVEAKAKGLVSDERDYRAQLNQVDQLYQQYFGRGVFTNEFTNYLKAGKNVGQIAKNLEGGAISTALLNANPGLANVFNENELAKIGATRAGLSNAEGIYLSGLYDYASQVTPIFQQYGKAVNRGTLEGTYRSGITGQRLGQQFGGEAFIKANKNDLQYLSGAFGEGQLSQAELNALGEQKAGYDTQLGNAVAARIAKAQQRLQGVFNGVLASPAFTAQGGRLRSPNQAAPDLGA